MFPPPMNAALMFMRVIIASISGHGVSRGPKMAVPTRTMVEPSAMAASKSALVPIDSVSRAQAVFIQVVEHLRAFRGTTAAGARRSLSAGGMHMRPRSRSAWQVAHRAARAARISAALDAALAGLATDVQLQADD